MKIKTNRKKKGAPSEYLLIFCCSSLLMMLSAKSTIGEDCKTLSQKQKAKTPRYVLTKTLGVARCGGLVGLVGGVCGMLFYITSTLIVAAVVFGVRVAAVVI